MKSFTAVQPLLLLRFRLSFDVSLFAASNYVGFGLMDAYRLVSYAKNWVAVPPQHMCTISSPQINRCVLILCIMQLKNIIVIK